MTLPLVGPLLNNKNSYSYSYMTFILVYEICREKHAKLIDPTHFRLYQFSKKSRHLICNNNNFIVIKHIEIEISLLTKSGPQEGMCN